MPRNLFLAKPVLDPTTGQAVRNADFKAHLPTDTAFATPLTITRLNGDTTASVNSGEVGALSDFYIDTLTPPKVIIMKSGAHEFAMTSFDALERDFLAAAADAYLASGASVEAQNAAEAARSAVALLVAEAVLSVNGLQPDANGNVQVAGVGGGSVLSVNDVTPNAAGNIVLTLIRLGAAAAIHTHVPANDLAATGTPTAGTVLWGDNRWAAPPSGSGGSVQTVNDVGPVGGNITIGKVAIGLPFVDNTSDADKPVSALVQAELNTKATLDLVVAKAGPQTVTGIITFNASPVVPDNAFQQAKVAGLVAALAARVNTDGTITGARGMTRAAYNALVLAGTDDPKVLYVTTEG